MRPWKTCADLCRLFGIEPKNDKWAATFCDLAEFGAILQHFDCDNNLAAMELCYMSAFHVSPLIFWSQLKRAVRPLVDAGGVTLRALGICVDDAFTIHRLLAAIADGMEQYVTPMDEDMYFQIKEMLNGRE